jgi:hypothetical protein
MLFQEILIQIAAVGSAVAFAIAGYQMFARGWEGYEQKYIRGAERRLDDLYLTIPTQHLIYLSVLGFVLLALVAGTLFGSLVVGLIFGLFGLLTP